MGEPSTQHTLGPTESCVHQKVQSDNDVVFIVWSTGVTIEGLRDTFTALLISHQ